MKESAGTTIAVSVTASIKPQAVCGSLSCATRGSTNTMSKSSAPSTTMPTTMTTAKGVSISPDSFLFFMLCSPIPVIHQIDVSCCFIILSFRFFLPPPQPSPPPRPHGGGPPPPPPPAGGGGGGAPPPPRGGGGGGGGGGTGEGWDGGNSWHRIFHNSTSPNCQLLFPGSSTCGCITWLFDDAQTCVHHLGVELCAARLGQRSERRVPFQRGAGGAGGRPRPEHVGPPPKARPPPDL